jgi:hypothetical protein
MAAAYAIVFPGAGSLDPSQFLRASDVGLVAAAAAWRPTQTIYRFDHSLQQALIDTPIDEQLPVDLLYHLPEWCVYLDIQEHPLILPSGDRIAGSFVHLEWDANTGRTELRFVVDFINKWCPIPLHLKSTFQESIAAAISESRLQASRLSFPVSLPPPGESYYREITGPLISLLLYLCTDNAEIRGAGDGPKPAGSRYPAPIKTNKGLRLFPAVKPEFWNVGFHLGKMIRDYQPQAGTHASPRPHIRRAHWHTFLSGPRTAKQKRALRWQPPIPVNVEMPADVIPTVRNVRT